MDRLFAGSAGERRRFLDRLVLALEPGHAHHSSRYEAAMRARNKLLAEPERRRPGLARPRSKRRWPSMAPRSPRRAPAPSPRSGAARRHARRQLRPRLASRSTAGPARDLAAELRASRARDAAAGRALAGPHRQDLAVTHRGQGACPPRRCSTGEQKALLLGLSSPMPSWSPTAAAQPPLLLLDEVAAHLDPSRRAALFARLEGRGQVWMTATEAALFDGIGAARRRLPRRSAGRGALDSAA